LKDSPSENILVSEVTDPFESELSIFTENLLGINIAETSKDPVGMVVKYTPSEIPELILSPFIIIANSIYPVIGTISKVKLVPSGTSVLSSISVVIPPISPEAESVPLSGVTSFTSYVGGASAKVIKISISVLTRATIR
jgi:hypothetical protein